MSAIQCANIIFESTANNRIQYTGSNTYAIVAGGSNVMVISSTGMNTSGTLTVNAISANGSVGTANQVLTSNGSTVYWSTPSIGRNYALSGSLQKSSFADATTYYFGAHPQSTLITTAGNMRVYIPAAGTVTTISFSIYNNAGTQGTAEPSPVYFRLNNTTDYLIDNFVLNMAANNSAYYQNTTISVPVVAGDYFEFKQISNTWSTNPTNIQYSWSVYIT